MKIEGSASGEEKRSRKDMAAIRSAEKVIRKKGGGCGGGRSYHRKPRRRVEATSTAIQTLYAVCKAVFKGPGTVPAPADVEMLQQLLDKMKPEDVELSADLPFFRANMTAGRGTPRISYTTIYQCKNFSMCIFFLPPTAVIPLHNHPGMTVFSKLLLGSMRIKSYDFVDPATSISSAPSSQDRLARLVVNSDFTAPCDTSVLYPTTGGNIHTFTAITPCAVLDILGPPYSNQDGRDITYYRDHPYLSSSDGGGAGVGAGGEGAADGQYGWLEEIDVPDEATMDHIAYLGPQIIDI